MEKDDSNVQTKVDIGVLKTQVSVLTDLCTKMDKVIDKMIDQHEKQIVKIYTDMNDRRVETDTDIKEIHARIDTVLDKVQITELRIMDEIKSLRKDMMEHNAKEAESLDKLFQWKWMIAGGIVALSWLISHLDFATITKLLAH